MQLRRGAQGTILDGNNPIVLNGGHWDLFIKNGASDYGRSDYGLNFNNQQVPIITYAADKEPCPQSIGPATVKPWPSIAEMFATTKAQHVNLFRIFLTNGYRPSDLYPYVFDAPSGKLVVEAAIAHGSWNEAYFNHLLSFAQQADAHNIALQLSVFNFFDFDNGAWGANGLSPWNPAHALDITPGWSAQHLVADGGSPAARCNNFLLNNSAGVLQVKIAFINKLVATLRGQGNIIFELMNEPRSPVGTPANYQAEFLSNVAGLILEACGTWRPLLSVNASPPVPLASVNINTLFDIDEWKARITTLPHYPDIDIVSYHGISGMGGPDTACGGPASFPFVDHDSIILRRQTHFNKFSDKAVIFSADAVRICVTGGAMSLRDGQIRTSLDDNTTGVATAKQRHFSDLGNWSYWCLKEGAAYRGRCHFQNHSSYARSLEYIAESYAKANGAEMEFSPPFAASAWKTWQWNGAPQNDFSSATQFNLNTGQVIVQVGTVANPADASHAGAVEAGLLYMFVAPSDSIFVNAGYSPTSITIRSNGALVIPAVALRLHTVDANGNVGGLVTRVPALLNPGAPAGELRLSAVATAGQRYALILAADVGVQYQNHTQQGYGEIIVRYTRASLVL